MVGEAGQLSGLKGKRHDASGIAQPGFARASGAPEDDFRPGQRISRGQRGGLDGDAVIGDMAGQTYVGDLQPQIRVHLVGLVGPPGRQLEPPAGIHAAPALFIEEGGKIDQPKNTSVAGDLINCVVAERAGRQRGERLSKLAGGEGTAGHVLKLHGGGRRESRFENSVPGCSEIDIAGSRTHLQLNSFVVGKALIVDVPKSLGNGEEKGGLEIDGKIL